MSLFSTTPIDEVTVQHIADSVGMTPAAVYYHFASKEQILTEGMIQFRNRMVDQIRTAGPPEGGAGLEPLIVGLLNWSARNATEAYVYFVASQGLSPLVEAVRRETRIEMIDVLTGAVRAVRGRLGSAEAGVTAVALVSLIETSLASKLNDDPAYRGLGAKRFAAEVTAMANRIVGVD